MYSEMCLSPMQNINTLLKYKSNITALTDLLMIVDCNIKHSDTV